MISLTDKGFDIIDAAVTAHVKTQERLVSCLTVADRKRLDALLKEFLSAIEDD